ncbi:hypothetical protein ACFYNO_03435 [Kitasatospora sp. NPDC006697]|uniref:hypothetical protein n=1 Tax=Kitasatospora sp. NPDC006697 TaxID=3364020 RepID=UPI0036950EC4
MLNGRQVALPLCLGVPWAAFDVWALAAGWQRYRAEHAQVVLVQMAVFVGAVLLVGAVGAVTARRGRRAVMAAGWVFVAHLGFVAVMVVALVFQGDRPTCSTVPPHPACAGAESRLVGTAA